MRLLYLFLALVFLVLGTWIVWGADWDRRFTLEGTVTWIAGTGRWAWAAGIGLLVADLLLPLPGTVVMAALGYVYGWAPGAVFCFAGQMLAAAAGYGAGRLCKVSFLRRWLGEADYERGNRMFHGGGGAIVALSRALPILPEVVSCMAGMSRMPFGRFLLASACGSLPMAAVFAGIGASGKDAPWWAVAASIAVPAFLWLAARRWQRR